MGEEEKKGFFFEKNKCYRCDSFKQSHFGFSIAKEKCDVKSNGYRR